MHRSEQFGLAIWIRRHLRESVRVHFKPGHRALAQVLRLVVTKTYPLKYMYATDELLGATTIS